VCGIKAIYESVHVCVCVCVRETHLGKRVVLPYSRSKDSIIQSMKCICVFHIVVVNVVHRKKDRKKAG
jgi:hypothetical protein